MKRPPVLWSAPAGGVAYNDCLTRALREIGTRTEEPEWSGRWLWANMRKGDALLLHWPSFQYAYSTNPLTNIRNALKYALFLVMLRVRGVRIAWIAHNLLPHRTTRPAGLDALMRQVTIRLCHSVFAHGEAVRRIVGERYPAALKKLVSICHGHLIDLYPHGITRTEARQALGLDAHSYVFLMFGLVAPYKGVHLLPEVLATLPADTHLLIAGRFSDAAYEARIHALVKRFAPSRVHIHAGFVADADLPRYLLACDAMVTPYTESLTSGSAVLSISFGRPLVAPATGFLRELIGTEAGELYDDSKGDTLAQAMQRCHARHFDEAGLLALARRQDWRLTAERITARLMG